ncbi:MAG TPA: response regulator [Paludibacter sp.]
MKILIIEDDPIKMSNIESLISSNFVNVDVVKCISYMGGVNEVLLNEFDLILLDMSLPLYDDVFQTAKPKNFGGRDILKEMKRHKKKSCVKIITQYNEFDDGSISMKDLDAQLKNIYPSIYNGYIHYETKLNLWQTELIDNIKELKK